MALTINTNISSLMVQLSLKQSSLELDRALQQMTTGYRINSAGDDAAGYTIASKMAVDLSSYNVAQNNAMLGTSLLSTATSSLDLVTTHLQRMRDLAEQAANGTYGADSIAAIQAEIDQRTDEINRVMSTTEYNGIKLFEGDAATGGGTGGGTTTVDESKRVVNQTTFQSGETYYITTSDDLVKLQDLVNSGVDTTNVTFELMSDINMQGVAFRGIGTGGVDNSDMSKMFKGTFNGNQHVISNLTINTSEEGVGLFVMVYGGNIDSLGVENADISGINAVGGLVAGLIMGNVTNSYTTGYVSGSSSTAGLVVSVVQGSIQNSHSKCRVDGVKYVAGLVSSIQNANIENSYATGDVTGEKYVSGLVAYMLESSIENSYATGDITGNEYVGGLVAETSVNDSSYQNYVTASYVTGDVTGNEYVGGFIGSARDIDITNSYSTGQVIKQGNYYIGAFVGRHVVNSNINGFFDSEKNLSIDAIGGGRANPGTITGLTTSELNQKLTDGTLPTYDYSNGGGTAGGGNRGNNTGREFTLQIGIDSTVNSQITFDTALGFALDIDVSTTDSARNALGEIDEVLGLITAKQTEFGAVQNRLDSVLNSLNVSIDNTTSSLSTIRDADIAKVSADYIRAQILQQASASLLATANQAPSIALNLI